jgi:acyl-CoA synthetase (AMP-forming)/AMP-acid ligase II
MSCQELLKVKGFQVAPAELEGCLLTHPDVIDCCVVGILDDYSGELPRAYIVLSGDALKRAASIPTELSSIRNSILKVRKRRHFYLYLLMYVIFSAHCGPQGQLQTLEGRRPVYSLYTGDYLVHIIIFRKCS